MKLSRPILGDFLPSGNHKAFKPNRPLLVVGETVNNGPHGHRDFVGPLMVPATRDKAHISRRMPYVLEHAGLEPAGTAWRPVDSS